MAELQREMAQQSPLFIASQRLKESKENVTQLLKVAEGHLNCLCSERDDVVCKLEDECRLIEEKVESVKELLEEKKTVIIEQLKNKRNDQLFTISQCIESVRDIISKTTEVNNYCMELYSYVCVYDNILQVIDNADDLVNEVDQVKFFTAYPVVNNALEERFVDLLLSMDKEKSHDVGANTVDMAQVMEALDGIALQTFTGQCKKHNFGLLL